MATCRVCGYKDFKVGAVLLGCDECSYDLCLACAGVDFFGVAAERAAEDLERNHHERKRSRRERDDANSPACSDIFVSSPDEEERDEDVLHFL